MSISYKDLNPTQSSFVLNEKEYFLRPFDLAARVWADDYFATPEQKSGLVVLSEKIQDMKSFETLFRCCWHLLKRKRDFGYYENFVKAIEEGDDKKSSQVLIADLYKAFVYTLGVSEPMLAKFEEEIEVKKH